MLVSCSHCTGFVPANITTCPHCGTQSLDVKPNSKLGSLVAGVAAAATGGVVAVTLMACYGAPYVDNDGDGYEATYSDCNDADATIHPDAPDPAGDGIDQNCDGVDGINPDAGTSSSSSSSGGECVTCAQTVAATGLTDPSKPLCTTAGQTAFDALKLCACTEVCTSECASSVCQGSMATTTCSECVQTNCTTQNLDCSEN